VRHIRVPLADRSYSILVGTGLIRRLGSECRRLQLGEKCAIITDQRVGRLYARELRSSLLRAGFDPIVVTVPAGEKAKSLKTVERCYCELARHRLERCSFVVALGGGVVGDLAGFLAATYLRGIAFVQAPTTLLAQVDSSVGGKVGVNLQAGKNLVGAFYQPAIVLCDLDTLQTLPQREFRAGLAEVIKYGIIRDANFFGNLEKNLDRVIAREVGILTSVVVRCCQIKAQVVGRDETESGLRGILNFGHTIGHALEAISGYGNLRHGEAISIGQVAAAKFSVWRLGLPPAEATRIQALFERAKLPTKVRLSSAQMKKLFAAMQLDKKVQRGAVKFVLAERIGRVVTGQEVPAAFIHQALAAPKLQRKRKSG
jgi:3-dehydroquinate synthase